MFFRRAGSVDYEVFRYDYNSSKVTFATAISQSSDARLKENVQGLSGSLDAIDQLRGVTYDWIDDRVEGRQYGLIAQEVQPIFPDLVDEADDGSLSVEYTGLIPVLLEAVKELKADNEALRQDLEAMRDGVASED